MSPATTAGPWGRVAPVGMLLLLVGALHFGRELLEPFAIAALFTFLLAPAVSLLQRIRLPRSLAVAVTVTVASCVVIAVLFVVVSQLDDLRGSLTQYRVNISEKLSALGGAVASLGEGLGELGSTPSTGAPMPVRVVSDASPFALLGDIVGPLLDPLGTMAIVFVLVLFMLIYLEDLRDRIAYILNVRNVTMTIRATTEVSARISRYLLMTLLINVGYGIPVAIGLLALGIPNAILWGVLATLLRFIPYVGPWLAASMPVALSFAISPDWGPTLLVIGLFLTLELISNNIIEPWVYGSRTGLSPLAVIVAAVFWSWLWGLTGLLLSVPLTLILVVSGRYVRPLRFLYTLFGDGPGLEPRARFYQRLVADDPDEAARIAERYLQQRPLLSLFDTLLMPALRSLKFDEAAGWIQTADAQKIRTTLSELVSVLPALALKNQDKRRRHRRDEDARSTREATGLEKIEPSMSLAEATTSPAPIPDPVERPEPAANRREPKAATTTGRQGDEAEVADTTPPSRTPSFAGRKVTFIPAGDESDGLVGMMLAEVLADDGISVTVIAAGLLTGELVEAGLSGTHEVVVVGGFLPGSLVRVRHLVSRIAGPPSAIADQDKPDGRLAPVIVGLWSPPDTPIDNDNDLVRPSSTRTLMALVDLPASRPDPGVVEDLERVGARAVVHSLTDTAEAVRSLLRLQLQDSA